ncbi:unnamed protein product [Amoebophrya sp. A25]|nr:unnamed protein product [Amoebophrya sp. A25]|eukprot:GSA25T00020742001.1
MMNNTSHAMKKMKVDKTKTAASGGASASASKTSSSTSAAEPSPAGFQSFFSAKPSSSTSSSSSNNKGNTLTDAVFGGGAIGGASSAQKTSKKKDDLGHLSRKSDAGVLKEKQSSIASRALKSNSTPSSTKNIQAVKKPAKATSSKATSSKATPSKPKATSSKATSSKATSSKATSSKATSSKATTSSSNKGTTTKSDTKEKTATKAKGAKKGNQGLLGGQVLLGGGALLDEGDGEDEDEDGDDGVDKEYEDKNAKKERSQRWTVHKGVEVYKQLNPQDDLSILGDTYQKKEEALLEQYRKYVELCQKRRKLQEKLVKEKREEQQRAAASSSSSSSSSSSTTSIKMVKKDNGKATKKPSSAKSTSMSTKSQAAKDFKDNEKEREKCIRGFRPIFAAISDDTTGGQEIEDEVKTKTVIVRNYPYNWHEDDAKRVYGDPLAKHPPVDVPDWKEGDIFLLRTSWPLSYPALADAAKRAFLRALLDADPETAKTMLNFPPGTNKEEKEEAVRTASNRLHHAIWVENYTEGSERKDVLQAQNDWHGILRKLSTKERLRRGFLHGGQAQAESENTPEDEKTSDQKSDKNAKRVQEDNSVMIRQRITMCITEVLQAGGHFQLVNANGSVKSQDAARPEGGFALVQLLGDEIFHKITGTESVTFLRIGDDGQEVAHHFRAESRRQKVIMSSRACAPLASCATRPVVAMAVQKERFRRCLFALKRVYEKIPQEEKSQAFGGPASSSTEIGGLRDLVRNPAEKPIKRNQQLPLANQQESSSSKNAGNTRKDALPIGFLRQGQRVEKQHIQDKMQKVIDLCMDKGTKGEFPTVERNNIDPDNKVAFLGLGYTDFRQQNGSANAIRTKMLDDWRKKVWDACVAVAQAVAEDRAKEQAASGSEPKEFFWTGIGIGFDVITPVHVDGKNSRPSATFSGGSYTNGVKGYPCGRLFVHDTGGDDEADADGEEVGDAFYYPITEPNLKYDNKLWQVGEKMRGKFVETFKTWVRFSGKRAHATEPYRSGHRVCVVYFSKPVTSKEWYKTLKELGANPAPVVSNEDANREEGVEDAKEGA